MPGPWSWSVAPVRPEAREGPPPPGRGNRRVDDYHIFFNLLQPGSPGGPGQVPALDRIPVQAFIFLRLKFTGDYIIMVIAKLANLAKRRVRLTMISVNATELKNRMGRYLQQSVTEPVIIEKTHRPFAVILSYDEYERLQSLEDTFWIEKAKQAEKEGFVGVESSMNFIREATSVKT
jgi:antitoxin Phd